MRSAQMSAEELEQLSLPGKRLELVRGHLVVREPSGFEHATVSARLIHFMTGFVLEHELGTVVASEAGFRIFSNPDTVRAPDAAFIAKGRVASDTKSFPRIAPDLVAEVRSPGDTEREVREKVVDWLAAGSRLVWVIDPDARCAVIFRHDGSTGEIEVSGALSGEDVLEGFALPLRQVFPGT